MLENMEKKLLLSPNDLEQLWANSCQEEIKGQAGSYKIDRKLFLGKGGFGIVYVGIQRFLLRGIKNYRWVAIKEFKKSEKWETDDDKDKELLILSRFRQVLDPTYCLEVIDIFEHQSTRHHFLVTPWCPRGNLVERIRQFTEESDVQAFALRLARILKYIHYEALKKYRSAQKGDESQESVGIMHRDVKPANIVFRDNSLSSAYLLDFGVAKVAYSDLPRPYNNCGTNNYKAPEIAEARSCNCKVDIYSFGCTIYEILTGGDKLIGSAGLNVRLNDRQRYIKGKLADLDSKLQKKEKITNSSYWMQLLTQCLEYDYKKRWNSIELVAYLEKNIPQISGKSSFFGGISNSEKSIKTKRDILEINFEIFRLALLQDKLFSFFEHFYFDQPRLSKFTLYVIAKFLTAVILDRFSRTMDRTRLDCKEKLPHLKRTIQQQKLKEIHDKSIQKIFKEIQMEKSKTSSKVQRDGSKIGDFVKRFPEIISDLPSEPRRALYEFIYQKKEEIAESERMSKIVSNAVLLMDDFDAYQQMRADSNEFFEEEAEVISLRRLSKMQISLQNKVKDEGPRSIMNACKVENTVKSNINKEENKTDIRVEKKEQ